MKPECKYESSCYRRNASHFLEFSHPYVEKVAARIKNGEIEYVMSLELKPEVLEQSQLVAELMEEGKILFCEKNEEIEIPINDKERRGKRDISHVEIDVPHGTSSSKENVIGASHPPKKIKTDAEEIYPVLQNSKATMTVAEKVEASAPMHFFLSSIELTPKTLEHPLTLQFSDLLHPSLGILQESLQLNFMVELGWLLAQYCRHGVQRKPLLVLYGAESQDMASANSRVPTMQTFRVKPKYPFGSHHTKMSIMSYQDGSMRFIVHTGNLIESDWTDRTQGIWISPCCPTLARDIQGDGDSLTGFKKDLLRYLETYPVVALKPWIEKIRRVDMSSINVCFIPSTPGSHQILKISKTSPKWGHIYLSWLLEQHASAEQDDILIAQCSSIGSLGPSPCSWLLGELALSMSSACATASKPDQPIIKVIYPCLQDVRSSHHGLAGGGCLPYSRQGHNKQIWLNEFLHKWRSESRLRTKAMPHIKSYARISKDLNSASWFLLTSGNLSKAAWGMRTNKGANLLIRSFEAGVLFLPKFIFGDARMKLNEQLHLPYDLPLLKYDRCDEPWFIDNMR